MCLHQEQGGIYNDTIHFQWDIPVINTPYSHELNCPSFSLDSPLFSLTVTFYVSGQRSWMFQSEQPLRNSRRDEWLLLF